MKKVTTSLYEKKLKQLKPWIENHEITLIAENGKQSVQIETRSSNRMAKDVSEYANRGFQIIARRKNPILCFKYFGNGRTQTELMESYPLLPTFIQQDTEHSTNGYFFTTGKVPKEIDELEHNIQSELPEFNGFTNEFCLIPDSGAEEDPDGPQAKLSDVIGDAYTFQEIVYYFGVKQWFTPVPIENKSNETSLNGEHMPSLIYQYCCRHANLVPCPIDYFFVPLIVMIGSLIGHKLHIKPRADESMIITPILWGMYIGPSGSGKTPAFENIMSLLQVLIENEELAFKRRYRDQASNAEAKTIEKSIEIERLKQQLREVKKRGDKREYRKLLLEMRKQLEKVNKKHEKTSKKRFKTTNVTLPSLIKLLAENPNGLLLPIDELKGLLARLSSKAHEELRAFMLECARGFGTYDSDRISTRQQSLVNMALSVVGGIQPDSFLPYLQRIHQGTSDNDGWLHRFLLLVEPATVERTDNNAPRPTEVINEAMSILVEEIADSDYGFSAHTPVKERFVCFSEEAQVIYENWYEMHVSHRSEESVSTLMKSHLRKYDSLVPIIALIYEVVMSFDKETLELRPIKTVRKRAVAKAISLSNYLSIHAAKLFDKHHSVTLENAKTLTKKLPSLGRKEFTAHELAWKEWSGMKRDTEAVTEALEHLEKHFWVRRIRSEHKNGRSTTYWQLNPELFH